MLAAWRDVDPPRSAAMIVIDRFVRSLRTADWYRAAHRFLRYKLAPGFFAIFTVVACAAIVSHVAFYLEDAAGLTCTRTPNAKPLALRTHIRATDVHTRSSLLVIGDSA